MSSPYLLALHGKLVIVGKEPDGDSVRFVPDHPDLLRRLRRYHKIVPARDGSVQLRFEAVDAPEVHYGTAAQPLGADARNALLGWIGFRDVVFDGDRPNQVVSASPDTVPAVVLSAGADPYGRPIAYVLVGDGDLPEDGSWTLVDEALLARTLNARLVGEGVAYPTFYTSTPQPHREQLRALAAAAREQGRGVWAVDDTAEFELTDQASIGPGGQLILPKLFRRATDYLKAVAGGFRGNLADWLVANASTPSRSENDLVVLPGGVEVPLSTLVLQRNDRVRFQADVLDIVFVEK
jgi:endonuclease YncB( thermonuclease family)